MSLTIKQAHEQIWAQQNGQFDPVLLNIVRKVLPTTLAYDICGVQPMTGPSGSVFAMRPVLRPEKMTITEAMEQLPCEDE